MVFSADAPDKVPARLDLGPLISADVFAMAGAESGCDVGGETGGVLGSKPSSDFLTLSLIKATSIKLVKVS